jgi:hypothetical protein
MKQPKECCFNCWKPKGCINKNCKCHSPKKESPSSFDRDYIEMYWEQESIEPDLVIDLKNKYCLDKSISIEKQKVFDLFQEFIKRFNDNEPYTGRIIKLELEAYLRKKELMKE